MEKKAYYSSGLLAVCLLLSSAYGLRPLQQAEGLTLTIMTYNIFHGEKAYEPGKSNLQAIAGLIKEHQPDFVALQEVDSMTQRSAEVHQGKKTNLVEELAKLTGMHGYFGKAISYGGGGYGEGLLSRQPLTAETYPLPAPKGGEDRAIMRLRYTYAPGKALIFAGTHLCHEHEENRVAQLQAINQLFRQESSPVILAGDLNLKEDSKAYALLGKQWTDAAVRFGNAAPTISFEKPRSRIDYILLSKADRWEVLDVKVLPVGHSDHMPVLATVRLLP